MAAVSEVGASFREASFAAQGLAMMTTLANGLREGRAAVVTAAREAVEVIGSAMALSAPAPAPAQGVAAAPAPVVAPLAPKPLPSGPAAPPPTVPALPKPDLSGVLAAVEAAKAAIEALPPAASQGVAAIGAIFAAANFASHGQAMMTTLAAGIRAGTNSAVAAARAAVQQIRDHLPHSPAKVGPLSDLDRVQFGQTLATAIAAGAPRAVAAARSLAAGVAATVPAAPMPAFAFAQGVAAPSSPSLREPSFARPDPQMGGGASVRGGGSTAIHLTFAPTLNGAGGQAGDVLGRLKSASYDLVEMIRAELDRRERAKH
ncbi:MAG: hypothetical protein HZY79_00370 [Rhodoblastus sp.]|nr:MAG: hypothetical protein HZY79_00370 [Rhodoblastus sp.]